ncbi:uncharacterized protein LOC122721517 [Manihot esculenta]|uniref:uncharacterized protein LOC122721517 n=1 Tax=Manihot esculenta TaxID=3983 RepID=UPI001CC7A57F|nr:uncharacterized protein LOC122721517 [Manihot esculenta]
MTWSILMLIALRAKNKVGFVTGKHKKPEEDSQDFEQWRKVDSMVISWILNFIFKEIVEVFLYTTTSHELWKEFAQCFGSSNGPQIYQIVREISSFQQGNMNSYIEDLNEVGEES